METYYMAPLVVPYLHRAIRLLNALAICSLFLHILHGCTSETVSVALISETGSIEYAIPKNVKTLRLDFTRFKTIQGLDRLPRLNTIKVFFATERSDYSFISNSSIQRLVIANANIENIRFIADTPSLELVYIENCLIHSLEPIDLGGHPSIRLLNIEKSHVDVFPLTGMIPPTLEYLWLIRNDIESLDAAMNEQLLMVNSVSLRLNPIAKKLGEFKLPKSFAEDTPSDNELPSDLKRFFEEWWAADYSITGKDRP